MKSTIVYFDSITESKYGFLRGLIAFIGLIIFIIFLYLFDTFILNNKHNLSPKNITKIIIFSIIFSLLICSAIGVFITKNIYGAWLYGTLIGFVVGFSIFSVYSIISKPSIKLFIVAILFTFISGIICLITNLISQHNDWIK